MKNFTVNLEIAWWKYSIKILFSKFLMLIFLHLATLHSMWDGSLTRDWTQASPAKAPVPNK